MQRQGITTKKQSTNIIMVVTLTSPDRRYDSLFLSNYATLPFRDELSRIPGVGDVHGLRRRPATACASGWIPQKLSARSLTTQTWSMRIREQNVQVAAGQVGQPPTPGEQDFQ